MIIYSCPKCGSVDNIDVTIKTNAKLIQHENGEIETDSFETKNSDHHWDEKSLMNCIDCGYIATAKEFTTKK
jgi:uncharacterized Zn finger protein